MALYECACGQRTPIVRETIRLMPRLRQVRFITECGHRHAHTYPPHIIRDLVTLAANGVLAIDDVAPPVLERSAAPPVTIIETLTAHDNVDEWLTVQIGRA